MDPFLGLQPISTVQSRFSNLKFSGYSSKYIFSDLLTIFVETKSVTKSKVHCIFEFLIDFFALTPQKRIKMTFKLGSSLASTLKSFNVLLKSIRLVNNVCTSTLFS